MSLDLTVVVPTYNRRDLLQKAVDSLRSQTHPTDRYEILIISDGSTDGTDELFAEPLQSPQTRLIRQEKRGFGLSTARNLGRREAAGRLVMYLDDDMVADSGMVAAHVRAHEALEGPVAVCGRVEPAPDLPDTPFCQIVIGDICNLYKGDVDQGDFISFEMALSWQTSFDRAELERLGGYDETFRSYGWEDIEFSYRTSKEGLRFYYEPEAVSFHCDQRNTLASHGDRMRNAARMAPRLFRRHPDLKPLIPMYADKEPVVVGRDSPGLIAKKTLRRLFATRPALFALKGVTPLIERLIPSTAILRRWYYGVLGSYVFIGYREGLAEADAS